MPRGRAGAGWSGPRRRHKYRATPTFVTGEGAKYVREDLLRLASLTGVPTSVLVKHRVGPPTFRPLTLSELAHALRLVGQAFASRSEAERFLVLRAELHAGVIEDLKCQVPYDLHVAGGTRIGTYRADFSYRRAGRLVVEDVKGVRTEAFIRTKKHVEAEYGFVVTEVRRGKG